MSLKKRLRAQNKRDAGLARQKASPAPAKKSHALAHGVEIALAVLSVALWVAFFVRRSCVLDTWMLALWALVLVVSAVLLLRAERKLAAAERQEGGTTCRM